MNPPQPPPDAPQLPPTALSIITDLLAAMPDNIRNTTDEELVEAFLDMEADQVIRDTSQMILEARKFVRDGNSLAATWRTLADNCESEIARSNDPKSNFHMSRYAVTLHEQSAIIYRKCADMLEGEPPAVPVKVGESRQPTSEATAITSALIGVHQQGASHLPLKNTNKSTNHMKITNEQHNEFFRAARPLMELISTSDFHPHMTVMVTSEDAVLVEGVISVKKDRFPHNIMTCTRCEESKHVNEFGTPDLCKTCLDQEEKTTNEPK